MTRAVIFIFVAFSLLLWTRYPGGQVAASPITWSVDGRQYVSIAAGHALFTFGLPDAE